MSYCGVILGLTLTLTLVTLCVSVGGVASLSPGKIATAQHYHEDEEHFNSVDHAHFSNEDHSHTHSHTSSGILKGSEGALEHGHHHSLVKGALVKGVAAFATTTPPSIAVKGRVETEGGLKGDTLAIFGYALAGILALLFAYVSFKMTVGLFRSVGGSGGLNGRGRSGSCGSGSSSFYFCNLDDNDNGDKSPSRDCGGPAYHALPPPSQDQCNYADQTPPPPPYSSTSINV